MTQKQTLAPKPHVANCVGAKCPDRGGCLRYLRPTWNASKDKQTGKMIVQRWASYDIERQHFGDCPAKLPANAMQVAMARAV